MISKQQSDHCLDTDELRRLIRGQDSGIEIARFREHLASCQSCVRRFREIMEQDAATGHRNSAETHGPVVAESAEQPDGPEASKVGLHKKSDHFPTQLQDLDAYRTQNAGLPPDQRLPVPAASNRAPEPDVDNTLNFGMPGVPVPAGRTLLNVTQFLMQLVQSGLMTPSAVELLKDRYASLIVPDQPASELSHALVEQKVLTRFQASMLLQGRGKGLVLGQYVLLEKLGQGGMGQVYKAQHRRLHQLVAIKVLPPKIASSPEVVARFKREALAAASLSHPNIVSARDSDEVNGVHFLVMDYIVGTDLARLIQEKGPLPLKVGVNLIMQTARALAHAHSQGIFHRDVKPSNLILGRDGQIKMVDLGLARFVADDDDARTTKRAFTVTGAIMGTPDFMSPEQAIDTKRADGRSDIYSLGCTLFYILTGRTVFHGNSVTERLMAHINDPLPSLREFREDASEALEVIFERMLAKQPENRYQSMESLLSDLECLQLLGHDTVEGFLFLTDHDFDKSLTQQEAALEGSAAARSEQATGTGRPETDLSHASFVEQTLRPLATLLPAKWWLRGLVMADVVVGLWMATSIPGLMRPGAAGPRSAQIILDGKATRSDTVQVFLDNTRHTGRARDQRGRLQIDVEPGEHHVSVARQGERLSATTVQVGQGQQVLIMLLEAPPPRQHPSKLQTAGPASGPRKLGIGKVAPLPSPIPF